MKKLTTPQVLARIDATWHGSIEMLDEFKTVREKNKFHCHACSNEWIAYAKVIIEGHGCPACGQKKAKSVKKWNLSTDHLLSRLKKMNRSDIEVLGEYKSAHSKVRIKCNQCKREWSTTPSLLYKGHGCETCSRKQKGLSSRLGFDEFKSRIDEEHEGTIEIVGVLGRLDSKIDVQCRQCGYTWSPLAGHLFRRGCPKCASSKGEKKIARILDAAGVDYRREFTFSDLRSELGGVLRFDFAIFTDDALDRLIEYDGQQHFKSVKCWGDVEQLKRRKKNDILKDQYCKEHKIRLIRLNYRQYKHLNIEMLI